MENNSKKLTLCNSHTISRKINTIFYRSKDKVVPHIKKNIEGKKGYFIEILFHGLNYNAKRVKLFRPEYFIDVHKSEVYYIDESPSQIFKSRVHKRRVILFSYNQNMLNLLAQKIKEFRLPDIYTGKGLFLRSDAYKIKPGKIRKK